MLTADSEMPRGHATARRNSTPTDALSTDAEVTPPDIVRVIEICESMGSEAKEGTGQGSPQRQLTVLDAQLGLGLPLKGDIDEALTGEDSNEALKLAERVTESDMLRLEPVVCAAAEAVTFNVVDAGVIRDPDAVVQVDDAELKYNRDRLTELVAVVENDVDWVPPLVADCTTGATVPWLPVDEGEDAALIPWLGEGVPDCDGSPKKLDDCV